MKANLQIQKEKNFILRNTRTLTFLLRKHVQTSLVRFVASPRNWSTGVNSHLHDPFEWQ